MNCSDSAIASGYSWLRCTVVGVLCAVCADLAGGFHSCVLLWGCSCGGGWCTIAGVFLSAVKFVIVWPHARGCRGRLLSLRCSESYFNGGVKL